MTECTNCACAQNLWTRLQGQSLLEKFSWIYWFIPKGQNKTISCWFRPLYYFKEQLDHCWNWLLTKWCLILLHGKQRPVARFSDSKTFLGLFSQKKELQTSALMPENALVIIPFLSAYYSSSINKLKIVNCNIKIWAKEHQRQYLQLSWIS